MLRIGTPISSGLSLKYPISSSSSSSLSSEDEWLDDGVGYAFDTVGEGVYNAGLERFIVGEVRLLLLWSFRRDRGVRVGDPVAYRADCEDFVRRRPEEEEAKCEEDSDIISV